MDRCLWSWKSACRWVKCPHVRTCCEVAGWPVWLWHRCRLCYQQFPVWFLLARIAECFSCRCTVRRFLVCQSRSVLCSVHCWWDGTPPHSLPWCLSVSVEALRDPITNLCTRTNSRWRTPSFQSLNISPPLLPFWRCFGGLFLVFVFFVVVTGCCSVNDWSTISVLFIPLRLRSLIVSLTFSPPITSPTTSIPVFATLPRICLPIHFACSAASGMTKCLNRPPIVWVSPCPRW